MKFVLDAEAFDYAYYHRSSKGFMIALADQRDKATVYQVMSLYISCSIWIHQHDYFINFPFQNGFYISTGTENLVAISAERTKLGGESRFGPIERDCYSDDDFFFKVVDYLFNSRSWPLIRMDSANKLQVYFFVATFEVEWISVKSDELLIWGSGRKSHGKLFMQGLLLCISLVQWKDQELKVRNPFILSWYQCRILDLGLIPDSNMQPPDKDPACIDWQTFSLSSFEKSINYGYHLVNFLRIQPLVPCD